MSQKGSEKSIKVLHVIDSGGLYGAEVMLLNLAREQVRMGLDPTICSIGEKWIIEKPLETEALKTGLKVEKVRMKPGLNLMGTLRILRFIHQEKFNLIHSHGYKGNILLGFMPRRLRKIPLISTLHGWTSTGSLSKMRVYEWLDARSLKHADAVVAVNRQMLDNPRLKQCSFSNLRVVDNGISRPVCSLRKDLDAEIVDFCRERVVIGSVGRLSHEKGFHHLIDAFSWLHQLAPEMKLVIVGEGEERRSLEALVEEKGLGAHVLLPGYRADARRYLSLFKIFVLPSLTEGLPISLLEAMQYGLPIAASRVGGIPGVLDDGNAGVLVEPGEDQALAGAIWDLYKKEEHAATLGRNARTRVEKRYSSERMALEYLRIYHSLCRF